MGKIYIEEACNYHFIKYSCEDLYLMYLPIANNSLFFTQCFLAFCIKTRTLCVVCYVIPYNRICTYCIVISFNNSVFNLSTRNDFHGLNLVIIQNTISLMQHLRSVSTGKSEKVKSVTDLDTLHSFWIFWNKIKNVVQSCYSAKCITLFKSILIMIYWKFFYINHLYKLWLVL